MSGLPIIPEEWGESEAEFHRRHAVVLPHLDNHHNAHLCPYCNPTGLDPVALAAEVSRLRAENERLREVAKEAKAHVMHSLGHTLLDVEVCADLRRAIDACDAALSPQPPREDA